jgi:hypothetical protein
MANTQHNDETPDPTPPDCFKVEEIQAFQAFGGQALSEVNYYLRFYPGQSERRFLYCLELLFQSDDALLLCSEEEATSIEVIDALSFINRARQAQTTLNGQPAVQRVGATSSALWQPFIGQVLSGILLSGNGNGLYLNDALALDFAAQGRLIVSLGQAGGLAVSAG